MTPAPILYSTNLSELFSGLSAAAAAQVPGAEAFVVLAPMQGVKQEDRSHIELLLEERPEVATQLERGDHVAVPSPDLDLLPGAESGEAPACSILLLPLIYQSAVEAVLCLRLSSAAEVSSERMEALRQLCRHAAPAVSRLRELETLRHEVNVLRRQAEGAAEMERALAAAKQKIAGLEAASYLKTKRVERFVHDLSSPLQIIDIYSKTLAAQAEAAAREPAASIREKTQRIIRVMKQFRILEDMPLHIEAFDLRELWSEVLDQVRPTVLENGIHVVERIPAEAFTVYGDRAKLARVFNDLAANAAKFAPGGEIIVEFTMRDDRVVVTLSDTGIAIPPEVLGKVTDRYAPPPDTPTESARATGLPLIDDYVRLHGGKISVASKVGQGSTFILEIPTVLPHDSQGERKAS